MWFRKPSVELPIDPEGVGIIMWLLADIRAELIAIHVLLEDDNGKEGEEDS